MLESMKGSLECEVSKGGQGQTKQGLADHRPGRFAMQNHWKALGLKHGLI